MDEKFIECVKKFPCLWDTKLSTYKCNETKDAAWEIIVNETNIEDFKTAKAKWKKLRDNHRDALKRQNHTRSGQAAKQTREWKYQKLMEFLLPHMHNRVCATNFKKDSELLRSQIHDDNAISSAPNDSISDLEQFDLDNIVTSDVSNIGVGSSSLATQSSVTLCPDSSRSNKRKSDEISEFLRTHQANHQRMEKERAELKKNIMAPDSFDDIRVDYFFLTIAKSIKKLPSYLQLQVKRKAMNAVLEAEDVNEQSSWNAPHYGYSTARTETYTTQNYENNLQMQSPQDFGEPFPPGTNNQNVNENNNEHV